MTSWFHGFRPTVEALILRRWFGLRGFGLRVQLREVPTRGGAAWRGQTLQGGPYITANLY